VDSLPKLIKVLEDQDVAAEKGAEAQIKQIVEEKNIETSVNESRVKALAKHNNVSAVFDV
jgi:hypothetical protein